MKTLANSQILNNCVLNRGPKCSSYCYVEYTLQSRWATQRWKIKKKCTHGLAVQIWVPNIYIFSRGRHVNKLSRGRQHSIPVVNLNSNRTCPVCTGLPDNSVYWPNPIVQYVALTRLTYDRGQFSWHSPKRGLTMTTPMARSDFLQYPA